MANKRISELDEAAKLQDQDLLVIVQNQKTKKITIMNARNLLQGKDGKNGKDGKDGEPGPANTLSIGTVMQGDTAAASISGTSPNQKLNLILPKGEKGENGEPGTSPIIEVKTNTETEYILTIIHNGVSVDTPNLKGKNGIDGTVSFDNLTEQQKQEIKGEKGDPGKNGISVNCIKVNDEQSAIEQSTANPNNIYYW